MTALEEMMLPNIQASRDVKAIFRGLLADPEDTTTMLVLADALEEIGATILANAYRWAAGLSRWPYRKPIRQRRRVIIHSPWSVGIDTWATDCEVHNLEVYDWVPVNGDRWAPWTNVLIPPSARLPVEIHARVDECEIPAGGIHRAFMRLAWALQKVGVEV